MRGIFVTNPKYYRDDSKTTKIPRSISIIVVDDIITTGATMLSCMDAIKSSFKKYPRYDRVRVYGLSIAHTTSSYF